MITKQISSKSNIKQGTDQDLPVASKPNTISSSYFKNGGTVAANTVISNYTIGSNSIGISFNSTTGLATIDVAGDYQFNCGANSNVSAQRLDIQRNGSTTIARSPVSTNGTIAFSGIIRSLSVGDTLSMVNSSVSSATFGADTVSTYFSLCKIS